MTNRMPPATDWQARHIDDWNVTTFTEYMRARHRELFGIEYAPMRSWRMEQGLLGNLIGTRTKKGTHSKAIVKRFIDEAFAEYQPTAEYPGTNFGFIYSYRRNILQRIERDEAMKARRAKAEKAKEVDYDELAEWF